MYGDIYFCNFFDYLSKNQFVACFHLQVETFIFHLLFVTRECSQICFFLNMVPHSSVDNSVQFIARGGDSKYLV